MNNYSKPNITKTKEEKKQPVKLEKVTTGKVQMKPKSQARKLAELIVPGDVTTVRHYILQDVLIPTVKDAIFEIGQNALSLFLYPDGRAKKAGSGFMASKVNYGGMYKASSNVSNMENRMRNMSPIYNGFDYDEIRFESRGDVEVVLMALDDAVNEFGFVTVGAVYDLAGVTTNNTQTEKFCWTSLADAKPVHANGGWFLKMPRPTPID